LHSYVSWSVFALVPIALLVTFVPISANGIGVREGLVVLLLVQAHVALSTATALDTLQRGERHHVGQDGCDQFRDTSAYTPARRDAGFRFRVMAMGLLPTLAFSDPHRDPHRARRGQIPLDRIASIRLPVSSGWTSTDVRGQP
jgi:hypothetical protein